MSALLTALKAVRKSVARYDRAMAKVDASKDYSRWSQVRRSASAAMRFELEAAGARITDRGSDTTILLVGIRSSSTQDLDGAVHNWVVAAMRRLEREAAQ